MDPTRAKADGGNTSERKFIIQILWLSLAGGTASFTRVSRTLNFPNRIPHSVGDMSRVFDRALFFRSGSLAVFCSNLLLT
jgi:hypothetical protein